MEQWTDEIQEKIGTKRSEMQWYTVQHFSSVSGIKYIKEEWLFKNRPIVVVMNSPGTVGNPNALNMITLSGMKAFPFTIAVEEDLLNGEDWFGYLMYDIIVPDVLTWVNSFSQI